MTRREFHFVEGGSSKFWAIELDGSSHTVQYGRIGTPGQAQTKQFASDAEAKTSCEKLIAEKVKKGYVEASGGAAGTPSPRPAAAKKAPAKQAAPEPAAPRVETAVTRTIDLTPEDLARAAWPRPRQTKPKPEPGPFNLAAYRKAVADPSRTWDWAERTIPETMTLPEAHFWFDAMLDKKLTGRDFTGKLSVADVIQSLETFNGCVREAVVRPLAVLLGADGMLALIRHEWKRNYGSIQLGEILVEGFVQHVLPYLSDKEVEALRKEIRPDAAPDRWPDKPPAPAVCLLAAHLGMNEALHNGMARWPATPSDWTYLEFVIFSLGKPEWVEAEGRRLKLILKQPDHLRTWLAVTQYSGLDVVRDSILAAEGTWQDGKSYSIKEQQERMAKALALVKAPEAAAPMLEVKLSSRAPNVARQWLDEQVGNAVTGLIPVAGGRGKLADAALEYLRTRKREGFEEVIRTALKSAPADAAARVRKEVLERVEKVFPVLEEKAAPAWLKSALKQAESLAPIKDSGWVQEAQLPPIVIDGRQLNEAHRRAVLLALQNSDLAKPHLLLTELKQHAERDSLDAFAWALFEQWMTEGAPSKQRWGMGAIGLLGGDGCVLKLTPLLRAWPGESQHQRAVFGLECLRAVGSDSALMALNGIAQKLKFQGLKTKAAEFMEAIAKDKGLSRNQLEDRIVPDCDLDERGSRVFDFGPRQFRLVLGPGLKPMVKDDTDAVKADLPKPGAKDDTAKTEQALADWKLLKKQVAEVAKVQAVRLEQAMVTGRRWPVDEFELLLVKHPLMTNLARLLLWAGYDAKGKLAMLFRVTEDQTYADAQDKPCTLKGVAEVGIVHSLQLTAEQGRAWGEVFTDYEIIPPFPQLGRPVYLLQKGEEKAAEITRWQGVKVPAIALKGAMEKLAWRRGNGDDHGVYEEYVKSFPTAKVTALVCFEEGIPMGLSLTDWEDQKLTSVLFLPGEYEPESYPDHSKTKKVPPGKVDPIVLSEVLADVTAVAAKGK